MRVELGTVDAIQVVQGNSVVQVQSVQWSLLLRILAVGPLTYQMLEIVLVVHG